MRAWILLALTAAAQDAERGIALSRSGQYRDGEPHLRRACSSDPRYCLDLGWNLFFQNRFDDALRAIQPLPAQRRSNLEGQCLDALGRSAEAEKAFRTAIREPGPRLPYAKFLAREGRLTDALAQLLEFTRLIPDSAPGWLERGRVEFQLDRLAEAENSLTRAASLNLNDPAIALLRARIRALRQR
jgi:Flp pilus assembly protein TadD